MTKIRRGLRVKWLSSHTETHWFKGRVVAVIEDRAIVDDGSGRSYRIVPTYKLVEMK